MKSLLVTHVYIQLCICELELVCGTLLINVKQAILSKRSERPIVLPDTFNGEESLTKCEYITLNVAQVNRWKMIL